MPLPEGLAGAVEAFCARDTVLVATDFDGVLAPFVTDPMEARAIDGTLEALVDLAGLPGTHAAVVSGRDLAVLTQLTSLPQDSPVTRIGSHGAQTSRDDAADDLDADERRLLDTLTRDLHAVLEQHPGVRLELKPKAAVLHTRGEDPGVADAAARAALGVAERHTGVKVLRGKDVVELSVVTADKGTALLALKDELGAQALAYFGDDVTDEHAFAVMGEPDLSIKVGEGETAARHRVDGPEDVREVLRLLLERRRDRQGARA